MLGFKGEGYIPPKVLANRGTSQLVSDHRNIGPITLTSALFFFDFGRVIASFFFIHTDNKRGREPGFLPPLFLLVELPVLDLVVEAGRLLAGYRVLKRNQSWDV